MPTKKDTTSTTTTAPKKSVRKKTAQTKPAEQVSLPNNMPVRAKEKVSILNTNLDEYLRKSALYVSYVSGACFLLVGIALLSFHIQSTNVSKQLAAVSDTMTSTQTNGVYSTVAETITNTLETQLLPPPEFVFRTTIPGKLDSPYPVRFSAVNTRSFEVFDHHLEMDKRTSLNHRPVDTDIYTTIIPAQELRPGTHQLIVVLRDLNDDTPHIYRSTKYTVPEPPVVTTVDDAVSTQTSTTSTESTEGTDSNVIDYGVSIESETTTEQPIESVEETIRIEPSILDVKKQFILRESSLNILTGSVTLNLQAPEQVLDVQLYARPLNTLRAQFVSKGIKGMNDNWYLHFDSANLPNGDYEFFAVTSYNTAKIESNSFKRSVHNKLISTTEPVTETITTEELKTTTTEPVTDITETMVETDSSTADNPRRVLEPIREAREFADPNFEQTTAEDSVEDEANRLLRDNDLTLRELLRRYAVAVQSGDETTIKLTEEAIEKKRRELAFRSLQDTSTVDIADNIDEQLMRKITDAKQRVVQFERLRSERTAGKAAIDTDQDGISDIDERLLFNTDPTVADSDNDGITDGVEVSGGFDPNDPTPEAAVTYESPKETIGVVREDVLVVETVKPAVEHSEAERGTMTSAIIRGKALPNSFVTLHIFSAPTVVTVRTDADGSFEYTFDKELEDGSHEVYVAMTDNVGRIVAQSNPFRFIKEAQAFTPVNALEPANTVTIAAPPQQSYSLTIGLSVLSFGLILLMLGTTLRRQKTDVITEAEPGQNTIAS